MFFKEQNANKSQAEKQTSKAGEREPETGSSRSKTVDSSPVAGPSTGSCPKSPAYKLSEVSIP